MKKAIVLAILSLLAVSLVSAGSIYNADYKDHNLAWYTWRQIDDSDVDVDADTLDGLTASELGTTNIYQGSGFSYSDFVKLFFGDVKFFYDFDGTVMDYLVSVFVTQAEFDDAQLEQQQIDAKQNARLFACEQKLGMTIGYK